MFGLVVWGPFVCYDSEPPGNWTIIDLHSVHPEKSPRTQWTSLWMEHFDQFIVHLKRRVHLCQGCCHAF